MGILQMYIWIHLQNTIGESVPWVYNAPFCILNWKCPTTISAGQREIPPTVLNTEKNKLHFQYHGNNYIFKVTINHHKLSTFLLGEKWFKSLIYPFCHFENNIPTDTASYKTIIVLFWVSTSIFVPQNNSKDGNNTNVYNHYFYGTSLFQKYLYIQCIV